ncbi:MAG: hypothetical protein WDN48_13980 [Pseudolabrys sp.]
MTKKQKARQRAGLSVWRLAKKLLLGLLRRFTRRLVALLSALTGVLGLLAGLLRLIALLSAVLTALVLLAALVLVRTRHDGTPLVILFNVGQPRPARLRSGNTARFFFLCRLI